MNLALPELLVLPQTADHQAHLQERCPTDQECIWANQADEKLSIELVRLLQDRLQFHPVTLQRFVLIQHVENASLPAQQALLKLLEEPPTQTHIFLTTTSLGQILTTIQSRCLLRVGGDRTSEANQDRGAKLYQRLTATKILSERVSIAGEFKDRATAEAACHDLLYYLHCLIVTSPQHENHLLASNQCSALLRSLDLLASNVSPRLVLEDMWMKW